MGLLDFTPEQNAGLLDMGMGLLAASGPSRMPVSFGQALASGYGQMRQGEMDRRKMAQMDFQNKLAQGQFDLQKEYKTLQEKQLQAQIDQMAQDNAINNLISSRLATLGQGTPQTVGYQLNGGANGGVRFNMGNDSAQADYVGAAQKLMAKQQSGQRLTEDEQMVLDQVRSRLQPVQQMTSPDMEGELREFGTMLAAAKPEVAKTLLEASKAYAPKEMKAGSFYQSPNGQREYIGDPTKGLAYDPQRGIIPMQGVQNLVALTGAQERAKAEASGFDPNKRAESIYNTGIDPVLLNGAGGVQTNGLPKKFTDQQTNAVTEPQAVQQRMGAISAFDKTIRTAEGLLNHPGLDSSVGLRGKIPSIPGTDAANFEAQLDTLKSQTFLPMVQQLKGMGALSNAEGEKLTAAVGALDRRMGAAAFRQSLQTIIGDLNDAKARAAYTGIGQMPQQSQPQVRRYNPATGRIE